MRDIVVEVGDPTAEEVRALLDEHLAFARRHSPPQDVHALDAERLVADDITFFATRRDGRLLAVGALRDLGRRHFEVSRMHTDAAVRGSGVGRVMLRHLLAVARERQARRVSLETGTMAAFAAARELYTTAGFRECEPFADYAVSPNSVCMTLWLDSATPM